MDDARSRPAGDDSAGQDYLGGAACAVVAGVLLAVTARAGAAALLVVIAALQAALALVWPFGLALPGRSGAVLLAVLASAAADAVVSVWPSGQLGTLLAVFGLAVPVLFVHQLTRGTARVRVLASVGGVAVLLFAEVALPALLLLRHEFVGTAAGTDAVVGVVASGSAALAVGYLVDAAHAAPRFDAEVPRGLLAVALATAAGTAAGQLALSGSAEFRGASGALAGAALGALAALLAVAVAFMQHGVPPGESAFVRRARPVLGCLVPLSVLAPVGFLLCLAIRA